MLAADGRCKSLDAAASGYVRGESCTVFLLSAIDASQTRRQGQSTLPVMVSVRGSDVNQDGRSSSLTAPNGPAQQALIRAALMCGNVAASSVGVLEMHGTGTPLGDPIEVGAAVAVLQVKEPPDLSGGLPSRECAQQHAWSGWAWCGDTC